MTSGNIKNTLDPLGLFQQVPDPQSIRNRLGDISREAKLLRSMLRVSERLAARNQPGKAVRDVR